MRGGGPCANRCPRPSLRRNIGDKWVGKCTSSESQAEKSKFFRKISNFQNVFCVLTFDTKSDQKKYAFMHLISIFMVHGYHVSIRNHSWTNNSDPHAGPGQDGKVLLQLEGPERFEGRWWVGRQNQAKRSADFLGRGDRAHCDVGIQVCKNIH